LNDYLGIRRSLAYRLREPEGLLRNFVALLQAERIPYITSQLAPRWATQPAKAQPEQHCGVGRASLEALGHELRAISR
jgi:hypothetical protein